jgi:hypothetical protein
MAVLGVALTLFCIGQLFNPYLRRVEDKAWLDELAAARAGAGEVRAKAIAPEMELGELEEPSAYGSPEATPGQPIEQEETEEPEEAGTPRR